MQGFCHRTRWQAGDMYLAGEGIHEAVNTEFPVVKVLDLVEEEVYRLLYFVGKEGIIRIGYETWIMAPEPIEMVIGEVENAHILLRYS